MFLDEKTRYMNPGTGEIASGKYWMEEFDGTEIIDLETLYEIRDEMGAFNRLTIYDLWKIWGGENLEVVEDD